MYDSCFFTSGDLSSQLQLTDEFSTLSTLQNSFTDYTTQKSSVPTVANIATSHPIIDAHITAMEGYVASPSTALFDQTVTLTTPAAYLVTINERTDTNTQAGACDSA